MQKEAVEYTVKEGMLVEAWSPLATGRIFEVEEMKAFANHVENMSTLFQTGRYCVDTFLYYPFAEERHTQQNHRKRKRIRLRNFRRRYGCDR